MSAYLFRGRKRIWKSKYLNSKPTNEKNKGTTAKRLKDSQIQKYWDTDTTKWSLKKLIRLLHFYKAHPCLWDPLDFDHGNRKLRKAALLDITHALGENVTEKQVIQKLNVIRATYRYEKRRIKQRMKQGLGAKTKLKWFALADSFLRNVMRSGSGDADKIDSDLEDTLVITEDLTPLICLETLEDNDDISYGSEIYMTGISDHLNEAANESQESISNKTLIDSNDQNQNIYPDNLKEGETNFMKNNLETSEQIDNLSATPYIKTEKSDIMCFADNQRKWSSTDSLKLIKYLILNSTILNTDPIYWSENDLKSFEDFADSITLPLERVFKRVNILKNIISVIKENNQKDSDYKPNYIWWPLIENELKNFEIEELPDNVEPNKMKFNSESKDPLEKEIIDKAFAIENAKNLENFKPEDVSSQELVEVVEAIQPLKTVLLDSSDMLDDSASSDSISFLAPCSIQSEVPLDSYNEYNDSYMTNPISSVPPPSVCSSVFQEALDELFHDNNQEEEMDNTNDKLLTDSQNMRNINSKARLILDASEEDLLEGKWSLKNSVKFLRLYGTHRCLWDLKDPDYRSRELRYAAIKDIAAEMGNGLDYSYVSKKIKIFRITYMQHRKRMLDAIKLGKEPEIQLRWFPLADSFLRPHIGLRSIKDQHKEMPQFGLQYVYANLNLIDPNLLADFREKSRININKKKRKPVK